MRMTGCGISPSRPVRAPPTLKGLSLVAGKVLPGVGGVLQGLSNRNFGGCMEFGIEGCSPSFGGGQGCTFAEGAQRLGAGDEEQKTSAPKNRAMK